MVIYNEEIRPFATGLVTRKRLLKDHELSLVEVRLERGASEEMHSHEERQITYVVEGVLEFRLGTERFLVSKGDSIYVEPGVGHGVRAIEPSIVTCIR